MNRKIIVFALIIFIIVGTTVFLVIMDDARSRIKHMEATKKEYLDELIEMQTRLTTAQADKSEDINFDEAKKDLPDVDKIEY